MQVKLNGEKPSQRPLNLSPPVLPAEGSAHQSSYSPLLINRTKVIGQLLEICSIFTNFSNIIVTIDPPSKQKKKFFVTF